MSTKKNRLGRGLDALIPKGLDDLLPSNKSVSENPSGHALLVDINLLDTNPDQPRQNFSEKELSSLSQSIKSKGIIIPLVVNKKEDGRYGIIAGERRLRAAKLAELTEVPVIIKEKTDDPSEGLVLALLENLCREDLNPIEEAESFQRLEKDFSKTHQEIAQMTGRERPTVTNAIRLLKLPSFVQDDIRFKRLTPGHGRAMAGLKDPELFHQLRTEIMTKNLNVRQTEALVNKLNRKPVQRPDTSTEDIYFEALSKSFSNELQGLKVKINHMGQTKKLEIFYNNSDELEWLMKKFGVNPV
ncbi:chromosome partitioning protein ParB [Deltaproteobacteria bacterium Smac51]|nr:chromosome partitioning protein ParB [Deltaproteobacteria bacterium Smac51]